MLRSLHRLALIAALAAPLPAIAQPAAADPAPEPDPDLRYAILVARGHPHWWRAVIEETGALLAGTGWYWIDRDRQVADWDYPSIKERLTFEAWRLDNNPFPINFAWHAINGTGFHVIARSNNLSLPAALAYGMATSFAWEYLLEFREKVSINDVIVTPGSGIAIGEFFHWLGRYLNSAPVPRSWHRVPGWTLGFWHTLHNTIDDRSGSLPDSNPDALGLSADIWHRFRIAQGVSYLGVDDASGAGDGVDPVGELRLEGALAAIPGYLAPGRQRRLFADGNLTAVDLRISGAAGGLDLHADTLLVGHHAQEVDAAGRGRALTVGASLAYQYRKETLGDWSDRVGLMHLPGLAVDGHLLHPRAHLQVSARAHVDFAGIASAAYPAWKAANPDAIEKTILRKHGYYYAWGLSGSVRAELTTRLVTIGAALFHGRYDSQDGLDKDQEEIDTDVDATDQVTDADLYLRLQSPWALHLEGRYGLQRRASDLGGVHAERTLHRYTVAIGASF